MKIKKMIAALCCAVVGLSFSACGTGNAPSGGDGPSGGVTDGEIPDNNNVTVTEPKDDTEHDFAVISENGGTYVFKCSHCDERETVVISYASGTEGACSVEGNTITFSGIDEDSVYGISGKLHGNIVIDAEKSKFELELTGLELYSHDECPINVSSGDKVTLSAKKGTENYVFDMRKAAGEQDIPASVYAACDLGVQGKGALSIKSENNNGIHTKNDLTVKNVTLQVDCTDNALKGNDSVAIESGAVTLIARQGDGIKTTDSDVSKKGNQRGTVAITGGDILIYAACDGIDAAYDVTVDESNTDLTLQIFTDKYSKYSDEVTAVSSGVYYIRFNSAAYKYSLKFYNDQTDAVWCNSSSSTMVGMNRYFPIQKPSGQYEYVRLYIYNSSQQQGQEDEYAARTDEMKINANYDTIALQSRGNSLSYGWTNYTTGAGQGGFGRPGGMNDGNTDKGDHSTKGIKADNAISITAGAVTVSAYDDALHASNTATLENGESPLGNVTVTGGTLTIRSNDDGLHADGKVAISGGTVNIVGSYEGIEANTVDISGGYTSVVSSDDGVNGTKTSGSSINISGGKLYVYASGDGVDSNSKTSYEGITFSGGDSVIISTGSADSSIDTEMGYKYTGGRVIAVCKSGGMGSESTKCSDFASVGTSKTINLSKDAYLVVDDLGTVKMPIAMNSLVVVLGKASADISQKTTASVLLDGNGVYWA